MLYKPKIEFEGEFRYNKKWNGKGYDENGKITYELINGNDKSKIFNFDEELIYEGEYLMVKEMEKEKNIIKAI